MGTTSVAIRRRERRAAEAGGTATPSAEGTLFDPSKHKVEEVVAFMEANPQKAADVLDAELAGKARRTIVDAASALQTAVTVPDGDVPDL